MRQHLRRSRPGRPCRAPARRSRGHRPVGRPGQGVSSAPRIEGEAPYPFQRTSGPAADSVAPSVRPHEHVVGSGSPRCARPQSASTKREAGRGGRVTSRTARFRRADLRGQFRKTRLCSCLDSPFALVGILDRFALRRPVLASWRCLPDVELVGRSSRAGGLCHVPDRQAGLPRAEVLRQPQFAQRLSSPPASPRSPLRPAAPRTIPQASAPASTRTAIAPSWRSSSTSAAARSRARRCPFPRGVDWTTERLWRKL
jgi:hypothetical protein